jgi:hypothetical protein
MVKRMNWRSWRRPIQSVCRIFAAIRVALGIDYPKPLHEG